MAPNFYHLPPATNESNDLVTTIDRPHAGGNTNYTRGRFGVLERGRNSPMEAGGSIREASAAAKVAVIALIESDLIAVGIAVQVPDDVRVQIKRTPFWGKWA